MKTLKNLLIGLLSIGLISFSSTSCSLLNSFIGELNSSTSTPDSSSNLNSSTTSTDGSSSDSSSTEEIQTFDKLIPYKVTVSSFTIPNSSIVIEREGEYVKKEEVAAYVMYYKKMPKNFMIEDKRSVCTQTFPNTCMLYGAEIHQNKEGLLPKEFKYKELDIYEKDKHFGTKNNSTTTSNRGAMRFVFTYNNSNVINDSLYFTDSHYDSYVEYKNYYNGWTDIEWDNILDKPTLSSGNYVENEEGVIITYSDGMRNINKYLYLSFIERKIR